MLGKNKKGYRPKSISDITITAIKSKGHLYARRVVLKLILSEVLHERYFPGTFGAQQAPISYLESKRFKAKDLLEGKLKIEMSVSHYLLRRAADATKDTSKGLPAPHTSHHHSDNQTDPQHRLEEFLLPEAKLTQQARKSKLQNASDVDPT